MGKSALAYLIQYLFDNFENFFIAPNWWESIGSEEQDKILDLVASNVSMEEPLNGNGISMRLLEVPLPKINKIEFVNWNL